MTLRSSGPAYGVPVRGPAHLPNTPAQVIRTRFPLGALLEPPGTLTASPALVLLPFACRSLFIPWTPFAEGECFVFPFSRASGGSFQATDAAALDVTHFGTLTLPTEFDTLAVRSLSVRTGRTLTIYAGRGPISAQGQVVPSGIRGPSPLAIPLTASLTSNVVGPTQIQAALADRAIFVSHASLSNTGAADVSASLYAGANLRWGPQVLRATGGGREVSFAVPLEAAANQAWNLELSAAGNSVTVSLRMYAEPAA